MKKKHELLKYTYDNYPVGTIATYGGDPIECEGKYEFAESGWILNTVSGRPIYDSDRNEWAKIVKHPNRKFVMKSEDGVDLFEGDDFYSAFMSTYRKVWTLGKRNVSGDCHVFNLNAKESAVVVQPEKYKAFSTKQAAEKWIEEQNKAKELTVQLGMEKAIISIDNGISFYRSYQGASFFGIAEDELEQIYHAYKSLQS